MPWAGTRLEEIRNLAGKFAELLTDLRELNQGDRVEGVDFTFVEATVDAWVRLLSDGDIQELYGGGERPALQAQSLSEVLSSDMLSHVRGYPLKIGQSLAQGDLLALTRVVDQLSALFSDVANGLKVRDIPVSPSLQELIARYDFMERVRAADNLKKRAEELLASTQESASKASEAATSASEAAGIAGESIMASYFRDFAKEEWESATKFRVWTIVLLAVGGGLAAVFLLLPAFGVEALALDAGDYVHLAQRVIVTAAVFALAAYLARQSHQHRTLANWAKALSVQLKTFEAFMAPLESTEAKETLRAQFAARVFGEPPVMRGDISPDDSSPVPEKLWEILSRNIGKPQ